MKKIGCLDKNLQVFNSRFFTFSNMSNFGWSVSLAFQFTLFESFQFDSKPSLLRSSAKLENVFPVFKLTEVLIHQGMFDGDGWRIGFQVSFSDIGHTGWLIHKDMIPWLVPWRLAFGHLIVPFFSSLKGGIHIINDSTVVKPKMMDDVTNAEFAVRIHWSPWMIKTKDDWFFEVTL